MRYFIVMALLCSCAEGGPPDNGIDGTDEVLDLPLGSFCLGDDAASRVCLPPDTVSVTVSSSGGATHVQMRATLQLEYELEGQVDDAAALPRPAERVAMTYPSIGTCRYSRPTSPFDPSCGLFDTPTIAEASAYDDPELVSLDLVVLDETQVGGRFTAHLPFNMPQGACENDSSCTDADPPEFTPEAALPSAGLFRLEL